MFFLCSESFLSGAMVAPCLSKSIHGWICFFCYANVCLLIYIIQGSILFVFSCMLNLI